LSSDIVFSGERGHYREEDEPAPVNDYGRSKAEAERVVRAEHPDALIARTSLLYGGLEPGPQEQLARAGSTFFVDEIRSPVAVGDLADALLELAARDIGGILRLGVEPVAGRAGVADDEADQPAEDGADEQRREAEHVRDRPGLAERGQRDRAEEGAGHDAGHGGSDANQRCAPVEPGGVLLDHLGVVVRHGVHAYFIGSSDGS